jgi:hypothetical protein
MKFGRITAVEFIGTVNRNSYWKFICDCGNEFVAAGRYAIEGHKKSCGCIHKKKDRQSLGMNYHFRSTVKSARKRNLCFDLSFEQFSTIAKQNCFYCGVNPRMKVNPYTKSNGVVKPHFRDLRKQTVLTAVDTVNGLDRVDNKVGYVLSNVVPCCKICNRAKGDLSIQDFEQWLSNLTEYTYARRG